MLTSFRFFQKSRLTGEHGGPARSRLLRWLGLSVFVLLASLSPAAIAGGSGEIPALVFDIGFCYLLAGTLAVVFVRLHIPEIAAFLVAGSIAGPFGLAVMTDPGSIDTIAQLGLILLLFLVGMELNIGKLLASGRTLMISGLLQYPLTVLFGVFVVKTLVVLEMVTGIDDDGDYSLLYAGLVVAASSTLLVIKLYQEHLQLDTQSGRISLGLLIFQDFWAIIVIALQANFASPQAGPILHTFAGIAVLAVLAVVPARYLLPHAFRWIAKRPEVVLVTAIAWCFAIVFAGSMLDRVAHLFLDLQYPVAVGASMAALIAGAGMASFPYSAEITGNVGIVRDFFLLLFFVGLGMSIPRPEGFGVVVLALCFALVTILARYLVFLPLLYLTGLDRRNAFVVSTRLAQVSEFSLVIGFLGLQLGHISAEFNSAIIFAFVLTALVTPALFRRADALHDRFGPLLDRLGLHTPPEADDEHGQGHAIVFLGFHRVASSLLHEIDGSCPEVLARTVVVDFNVAIHDCIRGRGVSVAYGDISNEATLHHIGIDDAQVIISSVPDDLLKGTSNRELVAIARHLNPGAVIIANAVEIVERQHIYDAGADYVFVPRVESAHAVTNALQSALNGDIVLFREAMDEVHGDWSKRVEVLP